MINYNHLSPRFSGRRANHISGKVIHLMSTEFRFLRELMKRLKRVCSTNKLSITSGVIIRINICIVDKALNLNGKPNLIRTVTAVVDPLDNYKI